MIKQELLDLIKGDKDIRDALIDLFSGVLYDCSVSEDGKIYYT